MSGAKTPAKGKGESKTSTEVSKQRRRLLVGIIIAVGLAAAAYLAVRWLLTGTDPEKAASRLTKTEAEEPAGRSEVELQVEQSWRQLAGDQPLDQLNVILVTIDTVRADHLSCYGYQVVQTPNIDRLAAEGVRFANAATTVPFTLPAHSSIMTGTYPPYHGVRENVGYFLDESIPTTAELLADAGYSTSAFVSAFVLDSRWGIARGFDRYFDDFDVATNQQINLGSVQRDGAETIAEAISWLDQRPSGPFFLWLHLFDAHEPYTPPEPYRSRYAHPYDGEIAYTDDLVGRFRDALEQRGLLTSSMLILTGDHGEGLGSHSEGFHGYFVYDSTVHIPLIIRLPFTGLAGRVVSDVVSHVDLQPTILAAIGQSPAEDSQGESLIPLMLNLDRIDGQANQGSQERAVYCESYYPLFHYGWAPLRSLRTTHHKYIDAPTPELYHLTDDWQESHNLVDTQGNLAEDLEQRLSSMLAMLDRDQEGTPTQPDLDEATLQQLRALGYVAGKGEVAVEEESEVERADPKDKIQIHKRIMTAQSMISKGDERAAEQQLQEVLSQDAGMIDACQMLGNIYFKREQYELAVDLFKQALAADQDHQASIFGLASSYRKLGRVDEAILGFRRLHELSPHDSKAAVSIADIYADQNQLPAALTMIEEATRLADAPALVYNKHGELLALLGRPAEAVPAFQRALDKNQELPQPHFNLAVLYEEQGRMELAIEHYELAIKSAPKHFQAQFNLGRLYGLRRDLDRQQQLYQAAIESNPEFVRGYFFLAKLIMDRGGDLDQVEKLARQGLARDPEHHAGPFGYYLLADVYNRQGRHAEEQQAVQQARRIQAESNATTGQ